MIINIFQIQENKRVFDKFNLKKRVDKKIQNCGCRRTIWAPP